ncbi:hypothetical protein F4604DRAFT_1926630 [Suillus subluteus]|nr:hypothetical protein F4604DRAFT_1926630 [Suillus subluteus]
MVLPGPNGLNLEQLNKIMAKFVYDMIELYGGQEFRIYGHEDKHPIHSALNSEVSDLPASHKIEGLASFSSKLFMCPQCEIPLYYLADPCGFNTTGDYAMLGAMSNMPFIHVLLMAMIKGDFWASWSALVSVQPYPRLIDICQLGCGVHALCISLSSSFSLACSIPFLEKTGILWNDSMNSSLGSYGQYQLVTSSSSKADQWRLHVSVLFVGLFIVWEIDSTIPDIDAPKSRTNTKHAAAHAKNEKVMCQRWLETLLSQTEVHPTDEQLDKIDALTMQPFSSSQPLSGSHHHV